MSEHDKAIVDRRPFRNGAATSAAATVITRQRAGAPAPTHGRAVASATGAGDTGPERRPRSVIEPASANAL